MLTTMDPTSRLQDLKRLDYLLQFQWDCGRLLCSGRPHENHPYPHARHAQLPPKDIPWYVWMYMSGRGTGKTRSAAEFVKSKALSIPGCRLALVAPDFAAGRDIMIEGESGLRGLTEDQGVIPWQYIRTWNRSMGELTLTNNSQFKVFGTDSRKDAESLRGYQCHYAWMDELGTQPFGDVAFQMLEFCLRLGDNPQVIITTTPRPIKIIKKLVKDPDVVTVNESTYANASNLPPKQLERLKRRYEGTTLGRQELLGLLLTEAMGALWTWELINAAHSTVDPDTLSRITIAVDPAGSGRKTADITGIVVVGDSAGTAWILHDASERYSPEAWASKVIELYDTYKADYVCAEVNFGGDQVRAVLHGVSRNIPFKAVHASRGKAIRAEPVVSLYERGKVKHNGPFPKLETELCEWVPKGRFDPEGEPIPPSEESPGRLDAMVWGVTDLLISPHGRRGGLQYHDD